MYEGFYSKTKRLKVCGTRGGLLSNVAYGICGRKWTIRVKSERLGNKMMRVSAGSQYGSLTHTLLPLAEFTYNNTPSSTTGISPFSANKGYHPNLTIHPERDLASAQAKNLVVNLDELHQELKATIAEAQRRYQGPADARRTVPPTFSVGQQAFVKAKFFRTTRPSKKLSEKFLGPFDILAQTGSHSYTLRLPNTIRGVHPVFHVSMLEPAMPNEIPNRTLSPPPPVEVQGELEYEIAEVLDSKIDRQRSCKLLYYVRWLGYEGTDEEYSWLPASELDHASGLISDFHSASPDKPGPLSRL